MTMLRTVVSAALLLVAGMGFLACSSSSDDSGGGGESSACSRSCEAQAAGCPASGSDYVSSCTQLCAFVSSGSCKAEYDALYTCLDKGGWKCATNVTINGKPAPTAVNSDACKAESDAYGKCTKASAPTCSGADADGTCPSVACSCPDGTHNISGSQPDGKGGCVCLDETTCKTAPTCK